MVDTLSVIGYIVITSSVLFFATVDHILKRLGLPQQVVKRVESTVTSSNDVSDLLTYNSWKWRNRLMSLIHSFITGIWSLTCFYRDPKLAQDLISRHSVFSVVLVAFSIGYFLHDTFHIKLGERSRQAKELLLHHAVVVFCFGITIVYLFYVGYAVVALVVEINSIFLHIRQSLQMLGFGRQDILYRVISLVNIGTFIIFRITTLTWMTRWLVINRDRIPFFFFTVASLGMAVVTVINIVLLYRLLHSDFLKKPNKSELKKSN